MTKRWRAWIGRAVSSLACSMSVVALAQSAPTAEPPSSPDSEIDFATDKRTRMTVPIHVDGKGPYDFLIDTGAERTVISAELADKLDLDEGRTARVHSMSGVSDVRTAIIPSLQVSRKTVNGIHAPTLKEANIGASGMLGIDSLASQIVIFDFAKQKMTVRPSRSEAVMANPDEIVVTARRRFGRLVLVDARIDGQKIIVVLDTGSEVSIGNTALRAKLRERRNIGPSFPIELVSVTGGKVIAEYSRARKITLGGVQIKDLPVAFADVHPFKQLDLLDRPALLLGIDALRLFDRVSVDFANKKVRFLSPELMGIVPERRMAAR